MQNIIIINVPPGFAPLYIREMWVNVVIPLTKNPITKPLVRIGDKNIDGYEVSGTDAVIALRNHGGREEAAQFWEQYSAGNFVFEKDRCNLID